MKRFVQLKSWVLYKNFGDDPNIETVRHLRGVAYSKRDGYSTIIWSNGFCVEWPDKWLEPATMNTQLRLCMLSVAECAVKLAA